MCSSISKAFSFVIVLIFVCFFAECAAGSCLSYGHSCWGAHGKRDGGRGRLVTFRGEDDNRLLKRLFQIAAPLDFKQQRRNIMENMPESSAMDAQFTDIDGSIKNFADNQDSSDTQEYGSQDNNLADVFLSGHKPTEKLRLFDYLRKSAKIN